MMRRSMLSIAILGLAFWATPTIPMAAGAGAMLAAERHIAAAERAAGSEFKQNLILCEAARRSKADLPRRSSPPVPTGPEPGPTQVFDNLYFLGSKTVSAWAVTSSEGIILIDALGNEREAASLIEGGLRRLGLDPAQIKYLIITHAHGDHYGGAGYLVSRYHPQVVMSDVDWKALEGPLEFTRPDWDPPPKRDVTVSDADEIALGDQTVSVYVTPGHTLGTISLLIPVRDKGRRHVAALWGGIGFNFPSEIWRFDMYAASVERFARIAAVAAADVPLSNHAFADGTFDKIATLRGGGTGDANPFVMGAPAQRRFLSVLSECALANTAALERVAESEGSK